MNVRVYGDPFGEDEVASRMRSFLRLSVGSGMQCALSLSAVEPRPAVAAETEILLTDGVRNLRVGTMLPPAELELLLRAAASATAATAPVVVFAERDRIDAALRLAGLEWPRACVVLPAHESLSTVELLGRVRADLRWAGVDRTPHALDEHELRPWLAMPPAPSTGCILHVGSADPTDGTDLVIAAWRACIAASGLRLRLVMPDTADESLCRVESELSQVGGSWEVVRAPFHPMHAADARVILLPWRAVRSSAALVRALATGRPVCVSSFAATMTIANRHGICFPIGGAHSPEVAGSPGRFEPRVDSLMSSLQRALDEQAPAVGMRGRCHVWEHLVQGCPAPAPASPREPEDARPSVVLEAPFFETSSSAELSIETSKAILRRGNVDLRLVARVPFHSGLDELRRRAPELEPLLVRQPGEVDLWLSSGWPVRASRPACGTFVLRVDWEYGSLPLDLTPHVSQEADAVVVHSEHVRRAVVEAGRSPDTIEIVPHGVDAAMHEHAEPDVGVLQWKQHRPAVLFCGGMVWRKGFDVFLRAVLEARAAGLDFAVVIKSVGQERHYGRFNLRGLVDRFAETSGTPPLMLVEHDLSRAELASLYRACDLMLHPYRGEGFGMPVLEARAVGLPVIATAGGATEATMTGPGAFRIPSQRRELELPGAHVSAPWVLEPSGEATARLLIEALTDLPARQAAAQGFAPAVRSAFSWSSAAESIERMAHDAMARRRCSMAGVGEPIVSLPTVEPHEAASVAVPLPN